MANTTKPIIDANALEAMAKERPHEKFLKGSGVLKLIQAIRDLERANRQLQAEQPTQIKDLRKALQFYADGHHFIKSDGDAWDTVSGEPQNYWCDEAGTATVEDGSIAKLALAGHPIKFEDEDTPAHQGVAYAELPDGTYFAKVEQHNTGKVWVYIKREPGYPGGWNYFASTASPEHAQAIADAMNARASNEQGQAPAGGTDPDGEAFRAAAHLGLTLRFYGGCAQSSMPGTPSAYEVVAGGDRAAAMREAVQRAAAVIENGGESQRLDTTAQAAPAAGAVAGPTTAGGAG